MQMNPKVSVIIPVLNREKVLERSISSVACQNYRPLELIVVDNGSSDNSQETARRLVEPLRATGIECNVVTETAKGASNARNRGLREASGEYILFLDSDDSLRHGVVARAMALANADTVVLWRCLQHLGGERERVSSAGTKHPLEQQLLHTIIHPGAFLASAQVWHEAGCWDPSLGVWEDLEAGTRILLARHLNVELIDEILVDWWRSEDSITGDDFSSKAGEWEKVLECIGRDIIASRHPDSKRLMRLLTYRRILLAAFYRREGNSLTAAELRRKALRDSGMGGFRRLLLGFAFHYTRLGGRGAWRIIGRLM